MERKRFVLIDAYSLLYRAFYAIHQLSTTNGQPTNALYGFTVLLFNIIDQVQPDTIVIAFDPPGKTFRHTEYSEYKAKRKETPGELKQQLVFAREFISSLGIPTKEQVGYEADDIIGTLSKIAKEYDYQTTIVTGDLDALQLVDADTSVMSTRKGVSDVMIYTPEAVYERFGFYPAFVPDYKALVGDTSDNIPGVPGVGEKMATKIIQQYGHIESLLDQLPEVDPKILKKIEPQVQQIHFSKYLATIHREVPIEFDFLPYKVTSEIAQTARTMFDQLEFRNLKKRLETVLQQYSQSPEVVKADVVVESIQPKMVQNSNYEKLLNWIGEKSFSLYFESNQAQPSMFEDKEPASAYVAIEDEVCKIDPEQGIDLFKTLSHQLIFHNIKPLYHSAPNHSAIPKFDTALAGYVLRSDRANYTLNELIQNYLSVTTPNSAEQKAIAIFRLHDALEKQLIKESQDFVYHQIELPLIPVLADMEKVGVKISKNHLEDFSHSLESKIELLSQQIYELAGQEFLISSPKQLGEILFEKLSIPRTKKTKTGYSTGAEALQELALTYPICAEVLNWRELTKLKSTYADALPKLMHYDGRIHTTFNQMVAATGRLSSNDPNLQNIPTRTDLGREIRKAFIPENGYQLLSCDYSQIELRILAHYSKDEALLEAFNANKDVHTMTAALMFGIPNEQVHPEQRRLAKTLNFAVLYGVTGFGLASQLGPDFSVSDSQNLINQYFDRFPKVKSCTQTIIEDARKNGYTTTVCGRRRYFPDILALNRNQRLYTERQAMNAPFQGTASDMIKLAMIRLHSLLKSTKSKMLLQVHDDLLFELEPTEKGLITTIKNQMETALPLDLPIQVDTKIGTNWSEMKTINL